MLVLSRKRGEQITIGNGTIVSILSISGSRVRIGIAAPEGVAVLRAELKPFGLADTSAQADDSVHGCVEPHGRTSGRNPRG